MAKKDPKTPDETVFRAKRVLAATPRCECKRMQRVSSIVVPHDGGGWKNAMLYQCRACKRVEVK